MFEELLVGAAQGILTSVWVTGTQPASAETGYSADAAQLQQQLQQQHPTLLWHQRASAILRPLKNGSDPENKQVARSYTHTCRGA
jgi:hypothetical protein